MLHKGLITKNQIWLDWLARDKHSSFFTPSISNKDKLLTTFGNV